MNDSLYTSITALEAAQTSVSKLSQNLSNINSVSYKKEVVNFNETSFSEEVTAGRSVSSEVKTDFTQGNIAVTGNQFDIAIDGEGFLEVADEDGNLFYTRKGILERDSQDYLSVDGKYRISSQIMVPKDMQSMNISDTGVVTGLIDGIGNVEFGKLDVVLVDSTKLEKSHNGLYAAEANQGLEVMENTNARLLQGYVELSNVDMTSELMEMVLAQSMYQANAKVFQVSDEMIDDINSMLKV